jgi:predicted Zn-dependent protease
VIARVVVAVVAVVVLGWLAVMERDARLIARGTAAAQAGDVSRAEADFRAARLLNPDTAPDVGRAFVYQGTNRPAEAAELLLDVVEREPDNLTAWALLYAFTRERDPARAARARREQQRLDPLGAPRR